MTEAATKRLACCVPFCRRTTGRPFDEWICGKHWRGAPAALRASWSKAAKSYRRRFGSNPFWHYPGGSEMRLAAVRAHNECGEKWNACKAAAIERAAGL